jgi:hypothetical protein
MSESAATLAAAFLAAALALVGQWLFTRGERSEQRRAQRRGEFLPAVSRALTAANDMYWLAWDLIINDLGEAGSSEERTRRQMAHDFLRADRQEAGQRFSIAAVELEIVGAPFLAELEELRQGTQPTRAKGREWDPGDTSVWESARGRFVRAVQDATR